MAYSKEMGHKVVLEAKIGLRCPILAISPPKIGYFDIELTYETPKIKTFWTLAPLNIP